MCKKMDSDKRTFICLVFFSSGLFLAGIMLTDRKTLLLQDSSVDSKAASFLIDKVRVLCWILTGPKNLDKRAIHVKKTWGRRCDVLLFMSSVRNDSFPTIGLNTTEGYQHLYAKTLKAFLYIHDNYFDKAEWFLKADDDTYVIVDNLRYFLSGENPDEPIYFGQYFKTPDVKQGYHAGGAGYVLSKEALRRFGKHRHSAKCQVKVFGEDVEFSRCLRTLGVKVGNSTDISGRNRFHQYSPEMHLLGKNPEHPSKKPINGAKVGKEYISDYVISFHKITPAQMYALDLYFYHIRRYGSCS